MDAIITRSVPKTPSAEDVQAMRARNTAARHLLQTWLADDSGYEEATWPQLKVRLEANRTDTPRKLFHD